MIDIPTLQGSSVRDASGTKGEILSYDLTHMVVGWMQEGAVLREEFVRPRDPRNEQIEVLTLSAGWVTMEHFVGAETEDGPRGPSLVEDLENLLTEKPRSPYKTASKTGPALVGKIKHKRDYWDCSTGQHSGYKARSGGGDKYYYKCTGKEGEKKTISRDKGDKAAYQADYKKWWRDRQRMTAPHTRGKKTYSARAKRKAAKAKKKG